MQLESGNTSVFICTHLYLFICVYVLKAEVCTLNLSKIYKYTTIYGPQLANTQKLLLGFDCVTVVILVKVSLCPFPHKLRSICDVL